MTEQKYKYTLDNSFENAYYDCKLVDDSIIDEKSFQECDTGLVLANMDRILEALERQMPKKVDNITLVYDNGLPYGYIGKCPNCGDIIEDDSNYCICNCGQKVLWEEE